MAYAVVIQDVDRGDGFGLEAAGFQNLYGAARKAAHRKAGAALHEQHHVVVFDQIINTLLNVAHCSSPNEKGKKAGLSKFVKFTRVFPQAVHYPLLSRTQPLCTGATRNARKVMTGLDLHKPPFLQ